MVRSHARWLLSPENHQAVRSAVQPGGMPTPPDTSRHLPTPPDTTRDTPDATRESPVRQAAC